MTLFYSLMITGEKMSLLRKIACLTMIGMMMFGLPAYAEVQCPEHAETFENPSDGSVLCVVLEGEDAGVIVAPIVTDDSVEPGQALDDDASYSEVLAQQDSDGSATVYLDESLKRFATVYPACGSSNSSIELTLDELAECAEAKGWVDVCRDWQ